MKVKFADIDGEYGYVTDEYGEYKWHYEGSLNSVYAILVNQNQLTGHGRLESREVDTEIDDEVDFTATEKVRGALQGFMAEGDIIQVNVDGKRIA